jgi:hypothetical protein
MTNLERDATVSSPHRMSIAGIGRCCVIAAVLLAAGCARTPEQRGSPSHDHLSAGPEASTAIAHSLLSVPSAIKAEHEHLHHELETAIASGGKTGAQARKVATVLLPHFQEEEAYAMPPLGLLESVARNEPVEEAQARQAIQMAERLRREYGNMLKEHQTMTVELRALAAAARQEAKPDQARFADELIVHAQNEEQVLYPATLVLGEYLKLRLDGRSGQ